MPDISMCTGGVCPLRGKCYRATAKPNSYQSYFYGTPFRLVVLPDGTKQVECEYYWDQSLR